MDRKIATVVGATAALIAGSAAGQAASAAEAPAAIPAVASYSQLLEPIPNAVQLLKVADAQDQARLEKVQLSVQLGVPHNHHHHHHSNDWYRGHGYVMFGGRWVTCDYYNHHHHDHHHNHDHN